MARIILLIALAFPAQAGPGLTLWIDGQPVANVSGPIEYDAGSGRVMIETYELIRCEPDRFFGDRFEGW